jgi:hypothetical protein
MFKVLLLASVLSDARCEYLIKDSCRSCAFSAWAWRIREFSTGVDTCSASMNEVSPMVLPR